MRSRLPSIVGAATARLWGHRVEILDAPRLLLGHAVVRARFLESGNEIDSVGLGALTHRSPLARELLALAPSPSPSTR